MLFHTYLCAFVRTDTYFLFEGCILVALKPDNEKSQMSYFAFYLEL